MNRRRAAAVLALALLTLGACGTSRHVEPSASPGSSLSGTTRPPAAGGYDTHEANFLFLVARFDTDPAWRVASDDERLAIAVGICHDLQGGATVTEEIAVGLDAPNYVGRHFESETLGGVIGAAVGTICPDQAYKIHLEAS